MFICAYKGVVPSVPGSAGRQIRRQPRHASALHFHFQSSSLPCTACQHRRCSCFRATLHM